MRNRLNCLKCSILMLSMFDFTLAHAAGYPVTSSPPAKRASYFHAVHAKSKHSVKKAPFLGDKIYVGIDAGVAMPTEFTNYDYYNNLKPEKSVVYGGSIGYKFSPNLRESISVLRFNNFEFKKESSKITTKNYRYLFTQKISSTACMLNTMIDVAAFRKINPYIIIGVGGVRNKVSDYQLYDTADKSKLIATLQGKSNWQLAWNVGAGINYDVSNRVSIDVSYKYLDLGNAATTNQMTMADGKKDTHNPANPKLSAHAVFAGIRLRF
ncbi:exported hypothetical protein [Alphaproteobacteria bacterium]